MDVSSCSDGRTGRNGSCSHRHFQRYLMWPALFKVLDSQRNPQTFTVAITAMRTQTHRESKSLNTNASRTHQWIDRSLKPKALSAGFST